MGRLATLPEDTPALITFTSGSTGRPKAAVRSHGFLLAQNRVLGRSISLRAGETDLVTLPVFALANLAHGVTSVLAPADSADPATVAYTGSAYADWTPASVVASAGTVVNVFYGTPTVDGSAWGTQAEALVGPSSDSPVVGWTITGEVEPGIEGRVFIRLGVPTLGAEGGLAGGATAWRWPVSGGLLLDPVRPFFAALYEQIGPDLVLIAGTATEGATVMGETLGTANPDWSITVAVETDYAE